MTDKISFKLKNIAQFLPINFDFESYFNNSNPIDVEIGTGRPHFFFDRALNFKERNIIGIEWKYEFIHQAQKRIIRENIKNALALHGNAWFIIPLLFKEKCISNIFINFPDPWWKNKHKKRLLLNEIFLSTLKTRMGDDGVIFLQTDVKELFDYYFELINAQGIYLSTNEPVDIQAKSHREKKCMEQKLSIFRQTFIGA